MTANNNLQVRLSLEEITLGVGIGDGPAQAEPTGKYRWTIWEGDERVASSFTHYDSIESCLDSLEWLIDHASSLSLEDLRKDL